MRYSEVGKYGVKRLRREKLKRIGFAILYFSLGIAGALFITNGIPYFMELYYK